MFIHTSVSVANRTDSKWIKQTHFTQLTQTKAFSFLRSTGTYGCIAVENLAVITIRCTWLNSRNLTVLFVSGSSDHLYRECRSGPQMRDLGGCLLFWNNYKFSNDVSTYWRFRNSPNSPLTHLYTRPSIQRRLCYIHFPSCTLHRFPSDRDRIFFRFKAGYLCWCIQFFRLLCSVFRHDWLQFDKKNSSLCLSLCFVYLYFECNDSKVAPTTSQYTGWSTFPSSTFLWFRNKNQINRIEESMYPAFFY